jgi:hypothetical protein
MGPFFERFFNFSGPRGTRQKNVQKIDSAITDELSVINPSSIRDIKSKKAQDSNAHSLVERVYVSHTSRNSMAS